ncbi:MAG: hypothetical protein HC778_06065 [Chamaesiphon sp. CSU_1_12]|nr:hypothetical protein [Chamaesiphon sp. CSU_1_12]
MSCRFYISYEDVKPPLFDLRQSRQYLSEIAPSPLVAFWKVRRIEQFAKIVTNNYCI